MYVEAIEGIISENDCCLVEEEDESKPTKKRLKIDKMNYELAILELIHERLTYKGIWIENSYRYRDPEEDMPKDWGDDKRREYYYNEIKAPLKAEDFIQPLKDCMERNLQQLNDTILSNEKVKILDKKGGHIKLTPYGHGVYVTIALE